MNVEADGEYEISANIAGDNGTGSLKLYMDDVEIGTEMANEGQGFTTFTEVSGGKATLKKGEHELKLEITNDWIDIDYVEFKAVTAPSFAYPALVTRATETESSYTVMDLQGRVIFSMQAKNMHDAVSKVKNSVTRDIVSKGIYFVISNPGTQKQQMKKVVINEK